jgi:hypothetical protein
MLSRCSAFQSSDVASRALSKFPGWMRARAATINNTARLGHQSAN